MNPTRFLEILALSAVCLGGCAILHKTEAVVTAPFSAVAHLFGGGGGGGTVRVVFDPWRDLPDEDVDDLKKGLFDEPKDGLIDAVVGALEHEPYLRWSVDSVDRSAGLVSASAGLRRDLRITVSEAGDGRSRLDISAPKRDLKTWAKIYIGREHPEFHTAVEPEDSRRDGYNVLAAEVTLDDAYFRSLAYRTLHDRSQVPFDLRTVRKPAPASSPKGVSSTASAKPTAVPDPTAVPKP